MKVVIKNVSIFQLTANLKNLRTADSKNMVYWRGKIVATTLPSKKLKYG